MKFVIQRVNHAEVKVDGEIVGKIGKGFLVLIGVGREDTKEDADWYLKKLLRGHAGLPPDVGRQGRRLRTRGGIRESKVLF